MAKNYAVGYGRPPKATQFKRGKSGNPKGRPKATMTKLDPMMRQLLAQKYQITDDGRRKTVTVQEVILRRILQLATEGKPMAIDFVLGFINKLARDDEKAEASRVPSVTKEQLMAMTDQERTELYFQTLRAAHGPGYKPEY